MDNRHKMQHIVLFDCNSIYRRMHGGMKKEGEEDSPERAYAAMNATQEKVFKAIHDLSATHACAFFDGEEKTWRSEILPDYKFDKATGKEKEKPVAMKDAILECQKNIAQAGVKTLRKENYEADDCIATIVNIMRDRPNARVTIVSTDKDFNPLVYGNVTQYHPFDKVTIDEAYVKEKRGCSREKFTDLLALSGDAADGISGVPGIAAKKGLKLLDEYNDLETLILCSEAINGKSGQWITDNPEKLRDYKKLIDLSNINVDLGFSLKEMRTPENMRNYKKEKPKNTSSFSYGM